MFIQIQDKRFNVQHIVAYESEPKDGGIYLHTHSDRYWFPKVTVEEIDQLLSEIYVTIKKLHTNRT